MNKLTFSAAGTNTNEQDSWQDLEGEHNSDIIS